jgi:hypothetical protein
VRVNGEKVIEFYQTVGLRRRRDAPLIITEKAFKVTSFEMEDCGIAEIAIALKPSPKLPSAPRCPSNNTGLFLLGLYHTFKPSISVSFDRILPTLPSCGESFLQGLL